MNARVKTPYPFSIFKRADRSCFSVSFKDPNGKYLRPVSTGKKTETEAINAAFLMLRDGIPQNEKALTVQDLSLKDVVRKIKTGAEAEIILAEMKRLGDTWHSPITNLPITVDGEIKSRHVANAIMKRAGIKHHF